MKLATSPGGHFLTIFTDGHLVIISAKLRALDKLYFPKSTVLIHFLKKEKPEFLLEY